ncbi:MAG: MFS transporter [Nitrososphaeria archaeon]
MLPYFWRLNIATLLFVAIIQVVVPLIPRYVLSMGSSPTVIGLAVSSISVTALLFRPLFGFLCDRFSKSRLMIYSTILASLAYAILFFSRDIIGVVISRLIEGVALAAFVPTSIASAVECANEQNLGEMLGWRSLMVGLGYSLGPAIGGFLSSIFGYTFTFGIASVLLLMTIPLIKTESIVRSSKKAEPLLKGVFEKGFVSSFISTIMYAAAWMGMLTFISAYLKIIGYGDLEIGLFVSFQAASSLIFRIFSGKLSNTRPDVITYLGLAVMTFSFIMMILFIVPPYLFLASAIFGIGTGLFIPGSQTLALRHAEKNSGFLSGILSMSVEFGNMVGPIMFGMLIQWVGGYLEAFILAPLLTFSAFTMMILAYPPIPKSKAQ